MSKKRIIWFTMLVTSFALLVLKRVNIHVMAANVHELSLKEPYLTRINGMRERCARRQPGTMSFISPRFKYNDNLQLVMCENPKVASTTWQTLFLKLGGFSLKITPELLAQWGYHGTPNKDFKRLSEGEALKRLRNYTSFFATRHPFERLVSAYVDKFSSDSKWKSYKEREGRKIAEHQFGKRIYGLSTRWLSQTPLPLILRSPSYLQLQNFEKSDILKKVFALKSGEVSFQQFVNYIIAKYPEKEQAKKMDPHWIPQVYNCMPCSINYSFVVAFENLATDSTHLLEFLQRGKPTKVSFPASGSTQTSYELTRQMFGLLSEEQVHALRKTYADDFYIFNYDPYLYHGHRTEGEIQ